MCGDYDGADERCMRPICPDRHPYVCRKACPPLSAPQARRRDGGHAAAASPRRPSSCTGPWAQRGRQMSAVAERAGVQRQTVYRHFADEEELLAACSAHSTPRGTRGRTRAAGRRSPIRASGWRVALDELYGLVRGHRRHVERGCCATRRSSRRSAPRWRRSAPTSTRAARVLAAGWGARGGAPRDAPGRDAPRPRLPHVALARARRRRGPRRGRRAHRGDGPPCGRPRRLIECRRPRRRRRGSRSSASARPRRGAGGGHRRGGARRAGQLWSLGDTVGGGPDRSTRSPGCASSSRSPCWATTTTARRGAPSRSGSARRDRSPSARSSSPRAARARTRSPGCARAGRRPAAGTSGAGTAAPATRSTGTSGRPTRRRAWRPSAARSGSSRTRTSPPPGREGSAARGGDHAGRAARPRGRKWLLNPAPWARPSPRGRLVGRARRAGRRGRLMAAAGPGGAHGDLAPRAVRPGAGTGTRPCAGSRLSSVARWGAPTPSVSPR